MKKFGLGRKEKSEESEDTSRSRLFGSKKKKESPPPATRSPYSQPAQASSGNPYAKTSTPPSGNPYATQPSSQTKDPYAQPRDPYANPSQSLKPSNAPNSGFARTASSATQPPAYEANSGIRPGNEKSPVPQGGYGGGPRFNAAGGAGMQSGYGGNQYGEGSAQAPARVGGYGGLGHLQTQDELAAGKEALFGGAKERVQKQEQQQSHGDLPPGDDDLYTSNAQGPSSTLQGYGAYGAHGDRQLTAEEEEEEDVRAAKDQIRVMKQQDVSSTRNALRIAAQAEETGRETLARLGTQGEMIHETEKHLDLAGNQNRLAEEHARELKHLNRSMFAVKVDNPFTKSRRKKDRDESIMTKHREERTEREATRAAAYASAARQQGVNKELRAADGVVNSNQKNLAERLKYQFEADSEDEAMEEEIDSNLQALHGAATRLNALGRAMGKEVDTQNEHIARIDAKALVIDDQIVMNRARLDRIK